MNPKVIIYLLFSLFVLIVSWEEQSAQAVASLHDEINKEDAIRLRILANSDSIEDQALKRDIRDRVNEAITEWVTGIQDLEEAKTTIVENLPHIEQIVADELSRLQKDQPYKVEFSEAEFPTKLYGDLVYPAGMYRAVVITIGEGKGENWWCVLFPPLCFLDMSNERTVEANEPLLDEEEAEDEAEDEVEEDDIEVSFFVVELITNLLDRISFSEDKNL